MRAPKLFRLFAVGLLTGACDDAERPTAPGSPRPTFLTIQPAVEGMKIGSTELLSATLVSGEGTARVVSASWSSDAPGVAVIGADARLQAVSLGQANIRASYETFSAGQRVRVVSDYAGAWSGRYQITSCARLAGGGPDICRNYLPPWGGAIFPFSATLTQTGATVAGTLEFFDNTGRAVVEAGPVEGTINPDNLLILTGTISSTLGHPSETTLSDWKTMLTGDADHLAGSFVRNESFTNAWGRQQFRMGCALLTVERSRIAGIR